MKLRVIRSTGAAPKMVRVESSQHLRRRLRGERWARTYWENKRYQTVQRELGNIERALDAPQPSKRRIRRAVNKIRAAWT